MGEFWCERTAEDEIFTGGSVIMDYDIFTRSNSLKLKHLKDGFVSYKHAHVLLLTDGLELCGLLWLFLTAVWTLILTAPIHYFFNPYIVEFLFQ